MDRVRRISMTSAGEAAIPELRRTRPNATASRSSGSARLASATGTGLADAAVIGVIVPVGHPHCGRVRHRTRGR